MNVQQPRNLHEIRSFLGLTSYFWRYILGYASISAPLERLKAKDTPFVWNDDCESAFLQLKRALMKPPILVYPDLNKRFSLYVDSSRYAVGACLMQQVNGRNRVVAYASQLLTGSQKNWINKMDGISEIECWVMVVCSTRKFRCYLDKREFDLYTDHQALTWIFSPDNRTSNAKLARWAMDLSNLQFKVHHKPGTAMGHVDGLSHLPAERVGALTMADLLNPNYGPFPEDPPAQTGDPEPVTTDTFETVPEADFEGDFSDEEEKEDEGAEVPQSHVGPVDEFRLDSEQFVDEQQSVSWIKVLCAFLKDGAIPMDPFLRTQIVKIVPRYKVEEGALKRRVILPARAGHARSRDGITNYETFWLPRAEFMPAYGALVTGFEQADRKKKGLTELRRSSRLADVNAEVDENDILMA
ncbi:LOW QUALITY PROTEIN: Retrotransposon Polyprotein [Phytophthora megakarya]|uniref:Retrotransposon Polyprotein n=1 Tax=Phytophthora megakarya TaxID=4795 RepID=A0A225X2W2_9STRA|nr:LOW QUALITY PROTEIN: Retrotransposon Polyprotein [Phytophthora megakarya]